MNQNVKDYISEKVKEMISAHSCCKELKEAGQKWLDALGTEQEAIQTQNLIAEIEMDIVTAGVWGRDGKKCSCSCTGIKSFWCKIL